MKRIVFAVFMVLGMAGSVAAQSKITNDKIEQNGDFVVVTFDVATEDNSIPSNRKEVIIPYLYCGKDTLYLDPLEVYGKNRFKRERQEYHIAGDKEWNLGENQVMRGESYQYSAQAGLKRWMKPAQLGLKRQMVGCACENDIPDQMLGQFAFQEPELPARRIPAPVLKDVPQLSMIEGDDMEIIFKVSKCEIDPAVFNNDVTFGKILAAVDKICTDPDLKVEKIQVSGYASPEGTPAFNRWLGENRAKALIDYIIENRPQYGLTPDNFEVVNGDENWSGLKRLLKDSDIEAKDKVIGIIDDATLKSEDKKLKIKEIDGGKVWKEMLDEIYPHLRSARYLAVYYKSADEGSVRNINDSNELLRNGFAEEGYALVMKESHDARSHNTIGAALMLLGKFEEAVPWFEKAIGIYPEQAKANIDAIMAEYEYEHQQKIAQEEYLKKYE